MLSYPYALASLPLYLYLRTPIPLCFLYLQTCIPFSRMSVHPYSLTPLRPIFCHRCTRESYTLPLGSVLRNTRQQLLSPFVWVSPFRLTPSTSLASRSCRYLCGFPHPCPVLGKTLPADIVAIYIGLPRSGSVSNDTGQADSCNLRGSLPLSPPSLDS